MAFLDKMKKVLTSAKRQTIKDTLVNFISNETDYYSSLPERRNMLAENEKRELISRLTPREYDVYLQLLEGYTLKESAKRLSIKYSTANSHMSGIYRKLRVKSRAELIINYRDVTISNV
ncbi:MAG TPA: LuxR C-terminal-related transcriptional regulator [Clostridia bacterium]|nr:LuxR C-terminal-related transcriptional regulator [Clostridia bacterium]